MTTPPLTSVIMVSYHTGPVLDQAIASVLAQTAPVELILVNNGNPPEVEKELAARADATPAMRLLSGQGNVGFATACNLGAAEAKGDFLLFLNPDSSLPSDALAILHREAAELKTPYMLGARLQDGDGKDQRGCRRALLTPASAVVEALHLQSRFPKHRLNLHDTPMPTKTEPVPAISGAFMFLPKADFKAINGFDPGYFLHVEDLDFCLRFSRMGGTIYFVPDIVVTHVGGTSATTNLFLEKQKAKGFIRYFYENFSDIYPQPVLWMLDAGILARLWMKILLAKWREKKK